MLGGSLGSTPTIATISAVSYSRAFFPFLTIASAIACLPSTSSASAAFCIASTAAISSPTPAASLAAAPTAIISATDYSSAAITDAATAAATAANAATASFDFSAHSTATARLRVVVPFTSKVMGKEMQVQRLRRLFILHHPSAKDASIAEPGLSSTTAPSSRPVATAVSSRLPMVV